MLNKFKRKWIRFWMKQAGIGFWGRMATRNAEWFAPPYFERVILSTYNPQGYISSKAILYHDDIHFGENIYIGERVRIYKDRNGGKIELGDNARVFDYTFLQTGEGGQIIIGKDSNIHPRCQLSAYKSSIIIGNGVHIAPGCAFYPYDHGIKAGEDMFAQPLTSKGDIIIKSFSWIGTGVIFLTGGKVGEGAVIGAGSVVNTEIPDFAIAGGNPAKVIRYRN